VNAVEPNSRIKRSRRDRTPRADFKEVIVSARALVIVAVDGSPETEHTVEYAVSVAKTPAAELHAVQVVPRDGALWSAPAKETKLRARLRALRPLAESEGVSLRVVTLRGKPESAIPAYAQLTGASLIVVGSNYATSRLWRSSALTSRLSRLSPVPVVVVPPRMEKTASVLPKRVVAAVDFTVASAIALRTAVDVSKRHGASLTVLHAMDTPPPMVFSGGEAWRLVQRLPAEKKVLAERWIDEAVSRSTLRGVLRRAKTPVLVLPVIAGAHQWIDEVNEGGAFETPSTADAMARRAA
jgi:nucleotide-binding universal stress UspA family protein